MNQWQLLESFTSAQTDGHDLVTQHNLHAPVSTNSHSSRHSGRVKLHDTDRLEPRTERHFTLLDSQWPASPAQLLGRLRYQIHWQHLQ